MLKTEWSHSAKEDDTGERHGGRLIGDDHLTEVEKSGFKSDLKRGEQQRAGWKEITKLKLAREQIPSCTSANVDSLPILPQQLKPLCLRGFRAQARPGIALLNLAWCFHAWILNWVTVLA